MNTETNLPIEVIDFNRVRPGGYELDGKELGRGGQAAVFAAQKEGSSHEYAVKIVANPDDLTAELMTDESNTMHGLDHPNIAAAYFSGRFRSRVTPKSVLQGTQRRYYFTVMDRALGTVADEINRATGTPLRRIPTQIAAQYILDIIAGAGYANGERVGGLESSIPGIVHRDIKPANALLFPPLVPGGPLNVKLADFGIARRGHHNETDDITQTHIGAGSVAYAWPGQFNLRPPQYSDDRYAAGATGLHIVTGQLPFNDPEPLAVQMAHLTQEVPLRELITLEGRVDHVAEAVQIALIKAMAKNPTSRYGSMLEMGDAVSVAASQGQARQNKNLAIIDRNAFGWRLPMEGSFADIDQINQHYGIEPTDSFPRAVTREEMAHPGISRRLFLAGACSLLAAGGIALKIDSEKPRPQPSPEDTTISIENRLRALLNGSAPEVQKYTPEQQIEVDKTIQVITKTITDHLKEKFNTADIMDLIIAIAPYENAIAFDLFSWLKKQGRDVSSSINTLAEVDSWAATALLPTHQKEVTELMTSSGWADDGLIGPERARTNGINAANRGVVGSALALWDPKSVKAIQYSYTGTDQTARGYEEVIKIALDPTASQVAALLAEVGIDQRVAAAFSLGRKNPDVLKDHMVRNHDTWSISNRTFAMALGHLIPTDPKFVEKMLLTKTLDGGVLSLAGSSTMQLALRCAPAEPEITKKVFSHRLTDTAAQEQLLFSISLVNYNPDLARAVAADKPDNELLKLALNPTNATQREKTNTWLAKQLEIAPLSLGTPAHAAMALIVGLQQK